MIYKSKQTDKFTVLPNQIFEDLNDGLAIGILAYLLSKPNDWVTYKQQLYAHFSEGRQRIDKSFKLLEEKGYIIGIQKVDKTGKFNGYEWVVYNEPIKENRKSETRLTENRQSENNQLLNKDNTKERNNKEISFTERKEKFLEWFNIQKEINLGKKGLHKTLSKTTENNLKIVLKTNYDPNDLVRAFKNMCQNKYVSDHNLVTPNHFLRIDNLERYINQDYSNQNVYIPNEILN